MTTDFDYAAFTQTVIDAVGPNAPPRLKELAPILIRHLHAFIIEADVSTEEFLAGCDLLIRAGKHSSAVRNEMLLVSDIFGCEALLDTLDQTRDERLGRDVGGAGRTDSAILGPFYRHGVAPQPNGTSIIRVEEPGASYTHLYGTVFDADGKPLHGATIDIWHDAPDGRYDCQAPDKPENHCRGRFVTNANGKYSAIIIKPIAYPIASDNAAGDLLRLLDRHPMRPAHIHYWVEAPGHRRLVTQIFSTDSEYLKDDAVFAVKDKLVVEYKPISKDFIPPPELEGKMVYELEQDIRLQRA